MRHMVDGRKFGRNTSHRKAMFKAMANNLIRHEQMTTTVQKAKELRRVVDRLVTLGKDNTLSSKRLAFARTRDRETVAKLFGALAERYAKRQGGYTRVLRVDATRWGDGAEMAVIELVDRPLVERKKKAKKTDAKKGAAAAAHDHDHDHDHEHHDHDHAEKKARTAAPAHGKGKVTGATAKSKSAPKGAARKTPSKSGSS